MSSQTIYFPDLPEPTKLTWGLPTKGQMLSHVEQFQEQVAQEEREKYRIDRNKNQTGTNKNMGRKQSR